MRISNIDRFKGNTFSVTVIDDFEDEDVIYLNSECIRKHNIKINDVFSEDELSEIIYENTFRRAKERALYLLDYRDHSYKELYCKLSRNYPEQVCDDVMDYMVEHGYIDDRRFAENFARKLFEVKRMGKYRAKQEMRIKGLDSELIDEMIDAYEDDTLERLDDLVERKYARYLVDEKGIIKVKNALARQGYSYSDIKKVLEDYLDEVED